MKPRQTQQMNERRVRHLGDIPTDQRAESLEKLIFAKPEIKEGAPFEAALPSNPRLERSADWGNLSRKAYSRPDHPP